MTGMGFKRNNMEMLEKAHKRRANAIKRYYESLKDKRRKDKPLQRQKKALKPKRVKLVPVRKLIKKLDAVFAKYIRARDGNKCVLCGSIKNPQCGHLVKRGKHSTRYDESNCNCICSSCNYKDNFEHDHYVIWWVKNYGLIPYQDLIERSKGLKQWKRYELEELITKYEEKCTQLKTP